MSEPEAEREAGQERGPDVTSRKTSVAKPSSTAQKLYGVELAREMGLLALLKEDYECHHRDWTRPGFQALAAYRFSTWRKQFRNPVVRLGTKIPAWLGHRLARNVYGIEIYDTTRIGRRLLIGHQHGIVLHAHGTIGDDCVIRQGVTIGVGNTWEEGVGPRIGDRVSVGVGSVLVGNLEIGDDVVIGPNCVVTTNVGDHTTVFSPMARKLPRKPEPPSDSD